MSTATVMSLNRLISNIASNYPDVAVFEKIGGAVVDGEAWYTVTCHALVAQWIRQQPRGMWQSIYCDWRKNKFDIHEKLYLTLRLMT